jgi:hypothetical protein
MPTLSKARSDVATSVIAILAALCPEEELPIDQVQDDISISAPFIVGSI